MAWGADIAMFSFDPGIAVTDCYTPVTLARLGILDGTFKPVIDRVLIWSSDGRSLDFVNFSLGVNGIIDQYSAADSPPCCAWNTVHRRQRSIRGDAAYLQVTFYGVTSESQRRLPRREKTF